VIDLLDILKLLQLDACIPVNKLEVNITLFTMLFSFIWRTNCVQRHKSLRILVGLVIPTSNILYKQ